MFALFLIIPNILPNSNLGIIKLSSNIQNGIFDFAKQKGDNVINAQFEQRVITQKEIDEDYPCYVSGNKIICPAISDEKKDEYKEKLSQLEKQEFESQGIPVKNTKGKAVKEKHLKTNKDNIIDVNTLEVGIIQIGFHSNVFEITDMSIGVFNGTQELGNIYLNTGKLSGTYWVGIDLNQTRAVLRLNSTTNQPSGSDIVSRVRTHNLTNGTNSGQTIWNPLAYWTFDLGQAWDFSENNYSTTDLGASINFSTDIAKSGAMACSPKAGDDEIIIDNDGTFGLVGKTGKNVSFCAWVMTENVDTYNLGEFLNVITISDTARTEIFSVQLDPSTRTTDVYIFVWHEVGNIRIRTRSNLGQDLTGSLHHVCVVSEHPNLATIYVDGSSIPNRAISTTTYQDTNRTSLLGMDTRTKCRDLCADEMILYNHSISASDVATIYSRNSLYEWSDWSDSCYGDSCVLNVSDGRYVRIENTFTRTSTENVYLVNESIEWDVAGTTISADNPPTTTITTSNNTIFTSSNLSVYATHTDDLNLVNASIYVNVSQGFVYNYTINISGVSNSTNFTLTGVPNGLHKFNILTCDSGNQCTWNNINITFEVLYYECTVDANCSNGFACNLNDYTCYDACLSHNHCNSSSFCASELGGGDGTCQDQKSDTSDCQDLELSGLADNDICIGGYCFDDTIGTVGEYCTDVSNGCVNDGTEYSQGAILCAVANDYYQCVGGESFWSSLVDCIDFADPYNQVAKTSLGHTYCGYYSAAQSCGGSGCVGGTTADCGSYFFNNTAKVCGDQVAGVTDDIKREACDVNCGATYDLETCPSPNTLATDCSTCTPPVIDEPPTVSLVAPLDASTQTSTTISFQYDVEDENPLKNCSLWFNSTSIAWHLNSTNTSAVSRSSTNTISVSGLFNGEDYNWNIECYDNQTNSSFAPDNRTFSIDTGAESPVTFELYNNTENPDDLAFKVDMDKGQTNVTGDMYIGKNATIYDTLIVDNIRSLSGGVVNFVAISVSSFIDVVGSSTGVRLSNPFARYLRIAGKDGGGSLDFNLAGSNPKLYSATGAEIEFDEQTRFNKGINLHSNITKSGTDTSMWIEDSGNKINKLG